eukprot:TRINITY_DN5582_c0_g1_i2.p1 TRINITY_DN5582_c0_g1~~TRINITY_DN5582_c0_g1_i2.p1  ORF type:complete len:360 (+),score=76.74 TRINITY_DN5582_c0_g1_i2:80-1081(+)
MAALLRAAGALPEPGGGPMGVAKGAPGGMAVYVMHGETTTQVEVTAEATVGDVAAGLAEILGRDVGPLSFQGVPLQNDRMLADEGIGAEAVMNECPRHEAKFHPEVKGDHIEISNDGKTAERTQSFMKAIVCTSVPIASSAEAACSAAQPVGFEIVVDEWSDGGWAGSLKIGMFAAVSLEHHFAVCHDIFLTANLFAIGNVAVPNLEEAWTTPGVHVRVLYIDDKVVAQAWRCDDVFLAHMTKPAQFNYARDQPLFGVAELYGKTSKATLVWHSPMPLPREGPPLPSVEALQDAESEEAVRRAVPRLSTSGPTPQQPSQQSNKQGRKKHCALM